MRYGVPILFSLALLCTITSAYCLHMEAQWNQTYDELRSRVITQSIDNTEEIQAAKDTADMYGSWAVVSLAGGIFFAALLLVELVRDQLLQRSSRPSHPV